MCEVTAIWGIYLRIIAAYRAPDKKFGKKALYAVIDAVSSGVPHTLVELRRLGRTLHKRGADVLAFFDQPGTSNGPTDAINGRLKHLYGFALGFRNLTNYVTWSLLEAGDFRSQLHLQLRKAACIGNDLYGPLNIPLISKRFGKKPSCLSGISAGGEMKIYGVAV